MATVTNPTITSDKHWYDTGTAVTYKGYGVFGRANGFGNRSAAWYIDAGVPTALSTTGNFTMAATMLSPHAVHVTTKTQWQVSLNSFANAMLNSITAPTVTKDKYWYDSGTSVTVVLNGTGTRAAGAGTRLASYAINGGDSVPVAISGTVTVLGSVPIAGKESIAALSATQYQLKFDAGATGPSYRLHRLPFLGTTTGTILAPR